MSDNPRIVEEFTLPSNGQIYDDEVNPNVIMSSMKLKHEMLRLSASDDSNEVMAKIIDDCIESDLGISSYDLCLGDFQYLLFKLRIVTFGPDYELKTKCPFCGFDQVSNINLDELDIMEYDDTLEDLLTLTLPVSKKEIRLTLQSPRMLDRINNRVREYQRKHRDDNENPAVLFTIMTSIVSIDGDLPNPALLENMIKEMHWADANAILNRIELINNKIGVRLYTDETCKVCSNVYTVPFRVTGEFFRPGISKSTL